MRVWAVVKAFVLLGRLLLMERPRDRYCITFSRPPGANKLVNDCCGKNLGYVAGRRFPHTARSYFSSGSWCSSMQTAFTSGTAHNFSTCGPSHVRLTLPHAARNNISSSTWCWNMQAATSGSWFYHMRSATMSAGGPWCFHMWQTVTLSSMFVISARCARNFISSGSWLSPYAASYYITGGSRCSHMRTVITSAAASRVPTCDQQRLVTFPHAVSNYITSGTRCPHMQPIVPAAAVLDFRTCGQQLHHQRPVVTSIAVVIFLRAISNYISSGLWRSHMLSSVTSAVARDIMPWPQKRCYHFNDKLWF